MISDGFIMKINLKILLIIKRVISLIVNINKEIIILSLSVLNDYSIIDFKLNAFKMIMIFDGILFEIKMKLKRLLTFFSIIVCLF